MVKVSAVRHVRGFDVARPLSISVMLAIMLPLVILPLLSIFLYGTKNGLGSFWSALIAPEDGELPTRLHDEVGGDA